MVFYIAEKLKCDNNFKSTTGLTCNDYKELDLCTDNGRYGQSWGSTWGLFSDWADPSTGLDARSCEVCGCSGKKSF